MGKILVVLMCFLLLALVVPAGIALAQTEGTVSRSVSNSSPAPGEVVTVTLTPSGFSTFYAVQEDTGGLVYSGEYTADSNPEETTFTNLTAKPFTYKVKVPDGAAPGSKFTITGQFWSDPADKHNISGTTVTVSGGGAGTTGHIAMPGGGAAKFTDILAWKTKADQLGPDFRWLLSSTILIVGDATMPPTKTVQILIHIVNASKVGNMDIKVTYDPNVLQGMNVTKGSLTANSLFDSNIVNGKVSIAFVDDAGINGDGSLAIMQFKVVGQKGDSCQLVATVSANEVPAGKAITIEVINGLFTVGDTMKGDCDGEDGLTSVDALRALDMSVGKKPVDLCADMNDDGQVTSLDAAMIMKMADSIAAAIRNNVLHFKQLAISTPKPAS
jgi:hypothetical protein